MDDLSGPASSIKRDTYRYFSLPCVSQLHEVNGDLQGIGPILLCVALPPYAALTIP